MMAERQERPSLAVVQPDKPASRFRFVDDVEILDLPRPEWLVENMLIEGSSAEIFGPPESFKSFFALSLALSVASGRPFYGHAVRQGPVIYIAAEGIGGIGSRVDAWKHAAEFNKRAGVYFVPSLVNLLEPLDVAAFIGEVNQRAITPKLVIFDTLARCIPGGDENRQQDMGVAVRSLDLIRTQVIGHPTTLPIHHTPRASDTSRGSNALDGAMDTQILIKREGNQVTVTCTKQKDAEHFAPLTLTRALVQESVVLETAMQFSPENRLIPGDPRYQLLAILHDASLDDGLSTTAWLKMSGMKERSFYNARKFLVTNGYVDGGRSKRAPNVITELGAQTITANCNVTARETALQ